MRYRRAGACLRPTIGKYNFLDSIIPESSGKAKKNLLPEVVFHFLFCLLYFLMELPCAHPQNAAAEGTQLHQSIGGGYPYGITGADFIGQGFDVGICRFSFFCINYLNIVKLPLFSGISLLFVAVKYHHQMALGVACKTGQGIAKLPPGGI